MQVIELLHSLSQTGCTIVCSVHQPSSQLFSLFDDILILGQGKCFYCGPRDNIVDHFNEAGFICPNFYNPAEYGKFFFLIIFSLYDLYTYNLKKN